MLVTAQLLHMLCLSSSFLHIYVKGCLGARDSLTFAHAVPVIKFRAHLCEKLPGWMSQLKPCTCCACHQVASHLCERLRAADDKRWLGVGKAAGLCKCCACQPISRTSMCHPGCAQLDNNCTSSNAAVLTSSSRAYPCTMLAGCK